MHKKPDIVVKSTTKIANDWLWAMEKGNISALVLMDLSAAFDTANHKILLSVLKKEFGIRDMALKWYRKYNQDSSKCV